MPQQNKELNPMTRWIVLFFFFSGMAGLIYEIVWVRQLSIMVGGSAFSVSIVLTVFMGGLALGSVLASRFIDRIHSNSRLILLYGLIELTIGLVALIFGPLLSMLRPLYAALYGLLYHQYIIYNAVSGLLSMVILLVPTTLMGATLPVLSRFYIRSVDQTGARAGKLYGVNTAGGALGSLLCGFLLIRYCGMKGTVSTAVLINGGIGLTCLLYALFQKTPGIVVLPKRLSGDSLPKPGGSHAGIAAVLAASGFCAMSYEVIWTKLLALLAGPTTYSLTIVLFTFITGLALGSMLFGRISDRVADPFRLLIGTQLMAALSALLVSQVMGNSQFYFAKLLYHFRDQVLLAEMGKAMTLFILMLVPTLCLGAAFPISIKLILKDAETAGSSVGILYTVNTVGALLGSLCSGFLLIPLLGKASSLSWIILFQCATAGAVFLRNAKTQGGRKWIGIPLGAGVVAVCLILPRWNQSSFVQGRYQRFTVNAPFLENTSFLKALVSGDRLDNASPKPQVLFLDDGIGGFVAVCQLVNSLGVTSRYLSSSGKIEASTLGDLSTMLMLAHIPMLIHPNAQDVLVIGLGSGITAGQILHYPVRRLDILEISPEVVRGAGYFSEWNNRVLENPLTRMIIQDARTHMTLSDRRYDVITAEPSNIWMAGLANLFTMEYLEKVKMHLNPHGIYVQWFHAYQSDWTIFSSIGRTFQQVFENCLLLRSSISGGDFLFLGFKDGNDQIRPEQLIKNAVHLKDLNEIHLTDPDVIYPLIVAENCNSLFADGRLHTDIHPILEYLAPYQLSVERTAFDGIIRERSRVGSATRDRLRKFDRPEAKVDFAEFIASLNNPPFQVAKLSDLNETQKRKFLGIEKGFCEKNLYPYPLISDSISRNLCIAVHEEKITSHLSAMQSMHADLRTLGWIHFDLAKVYAYERDYSRAVSHLEQALDGLPDDFNILILLAYTLQDMKEYPKAIAVFKRLLEVYPKTHEVYKDVSECYLRSNDPISAEIYIEKAMQVEPLERKAANTALVIYLKLGEWRKAMPLAQKIIRDNPGSSLFVHRSVAIALTRDGLFPDALQMIENGLASYPGDPVLLSLQKRIINNR